MFGGKLFNAIIQKCSNAMMGVIYKAQCLNGKVIANSCDSGPSIFKTTKPPNVEALWCTLRDSNPRPDD
jgi:hypothetical protein